MWRSGRLARPIYEGLPWLYTAVGVLALSASYLARSTLASVAFGLPGLAALLAGIVVMLRRRDYRRMRTYYERPDALADSTREIERP
jgi:nitrate reductase gamma subunit